MGKKVRFRKLLPLHLRQLKKCLPSQLLGDGARVAIEAARGTTISDPPPEKPIGCHGEEAPSRMSAVFWLLMLVVLRRSGWSPGGVCLAGVEL